MSHPETKYADVFDYTLYKMQDFILKSKRNPDKSMGEIKTLEACLELYMNDTIHISWIDGHPYMSLHEASELDEDELKEKFNQIINGA
tara:strand:+ start:1613 stop:1876 length:264 start_codon:yes stop_codon:yes gene_type:complete